MASLAQLDLWLSCARTLRHVQELKMSRYSCRSPSPGWQELCRLYEREEHLVRAVQREEKRQAREHRGRSA